MVVFSIRSLQDTGKITHNTTPKGTEQSQHTTKHSHRLHSLNIRHRLHTNNQAHSQPEPTAQQARHTKARVTPSGGNLYIHTHTHTQARYNSLNVTAAQHISTSTQHQHNLTTTRQQHSTVTAQQHPLSCVLFFTMSF